MAGKNWHCRDDQAAANPATTGGAKPPYPPGSKRLRAYAEGREANKRGEAMSTNPHDGNGTPEEAAWDNGNFYGGNAACQLHTCR
tara:strand:- start:2193 stop:2447 length:255 start_codon:yes stop_codon:yes gene_type:complete